MGKSTEWAEKKRSKKMGRVHLQVRKGKRIRQAKGFDEAREGKAREGKGNQKVVRQ